LLFRKTYAYLNGIENATKFRYFFKETQVIILYYYCRSQNAEVLQLILQMCLVTLSNPYNLP